MSEQPSQRIAIGSESIELPSALPVLPVRDAVVFPGTTVPLSIGRARSLAALEEAGVAHDPQLVSPAHFEIESAEESVDRLRSNGVTFDAVFAASDLIALGAIRSLFRAGVRVPEDVSVVGYDDVLLARYSHPALTTVSQDMAKAGRLLVSKLLNSTGGQEMRSERLPTELIVRESCGG